MGTPSTLYPRPRARTRVDHASLVLLRSVMDEGWRADVAARDLLVSLREDRRLLRLLRARIARAMLDRPSEIAERAGLTLDRAFAQGTTAPTAHPLVPRQGGRLV